MADALPRSASSTQATRLARPVIERVQRLRLILDLATLDLTASETTRGPFAETTWLHRRVLADANRAWSRITALFDHATVAQALHANPISLIHLPNAHQKSTALLIGGHTYLAHQITSPPPLLRTLWQILPIATHDPDLYHVTRLRDGTSRCDCADWYFRVAEQPTPGRCKHITALESLAWL